ncbi:Putative Methyltransferase domain-containing protein [Septoria linicola]|uniref:Methyltransferase domain-containing protein n=1 Tax=Septoria linicola TaxID=215465 RepID=A0A9Q9AMU7_9PEZI|nr:Putative Methyltransferase domain-containing protein [Septoria linicola]
MAITSEEDQTAAFREFDALFNLRSVENEAFHLVQYLKPDSRIIDVGCGIGSITFDLARRVPHGYVLGVDFSAGSIATAKARAKAAGLTNVEFIQGDAMDLPSSIPSNSFDISHSHQVLLHLPEPVKALKSILRVVKPGGILTTRDNHSRFVYPLTPAMSRNFELYEIWSRERGCNPNAGHFNHIWMHEAGIPWDAISAGDSARSFCDIPSKRIVANTFGRGFAATYDKVLDSEEDKKWFDELRREFLEWAEKPESRLAWYDGWVMGKK